MAADATTNLASEPFPTALVSAAAAAAALPTATIVTATLNRADTLGRALDSSRRQNLVGVEHVVVDGGSTDGTMAVAEEYPHIRVIRQHDHSPYEAWNSGIGGTTGEIICILNADDELTDGALDRVRAAFAADPSADLVSGPVDVARAEPGSVVVRRFDDPAMLSLRLRDIVSGVPLTNGRFFRRRFLERIGKFDGRFRMVSDRDFLLRAVAARPRHILLDTPLYRYWSHPGSLTLAGNGINEDLAREAVACARLRLREGRGRPAPGIRDWHGWSSGYLAALLLRRGRPREAIGIVAGAFQGDPLWPFRFLRYLPGHLREAKVRRGRPVGPP